MRQVIERSFALLVQRWGILWRELRCDYTRWPLVLTACAKLHNFLIDENVEIIATRHDEDIEEGDDILILMNDEPGDLRNAAPNAYNRRTNFTHDLELKGMRRPNHAMINSRAY